MTLNTLRNLLSALALSAGMGCAPVWSQPASGMDAAAPAASAASTAGDPTKALIPSDSAGTIVLDAEGRPLKLLDRNGKEVPRCLPCEAQLKPHPQPGCIKPGKRSPAAAASGASAAQPGGQKLRPPARPCVHAPPPQPMIVCPPGTHKVCVGTSCWCMPGATSTPPTH